MKKTRRGRIFACCMAAMMAVTALVAKPATVFAAPDDVVVSSSDSQQSMDAPVSSYVHSPFDENSNINETAGEITAFGGEVGTQYGAQATSAALFAPTGLWISNTGVLSWNRSSVSIGTGFEIFVNGSSVGTTGAWTTSFNLANVSGWGWSGNVQVRELGDGLNTFTSALSHPVSGNWGGGGGTSVHLPAPSLWISGSTLSWSPVTGAVGYRVYINGIVRSNLISGTSFDLANATLSWGWSSSDIRVRAISGVSTTLDSGLSNAVSFNVASTGHLPAPTGLWISGNTLHWNPVSNASGYRVYVDGSPVSGVLSGTSWNLGNIGWNWNWGSHNVRVRALGNSSTTLDSALSHAVSHNWGGITGTLPAPTGLWISGNTLHWSHVGGASGYRVYVDGVAVSGTLSGTSFNLGNINWGWNWNSHNVRVRALGNGSTTFNSALSHAVSSHGHWYGWHGQLSAPTSLWISSSGVLHWNSVSGAWGYRVYVGGMAVSNTISGTSFNLTNLSLWNWEHGWNWGWAGHNVQVRAIGNGTTVFSSGLSSSVSSWNWGTSYWAPSSAPAATPRPTATPAPTPAAPVATPANAPTNLRLEGNVLHWTPVPNAASYVIYVGGAVHSAPTVATHFSLSALGLPVGHYTVQVRALGDGGRVLNSGLSNGLAFASTGTGVTPVATPATTPQPVGIFDVNQPSEWAANSVNIAIAEGLVPENLQSRYTYATTRLDFATLAVTLYEAVMGYEIWPRMYFNDTDDIYVRKLGTIGVIQGNGDGYFGPDELVTREEVALMLARLSDAMNRPFPRVNPEFADNSIISPWALGAVGQMQAAGIIDGVGDNFVPDGSFSREQSIVSMLRLFDIVGR